MFWIPISAVLLCVYLLAHTVGGVQTAKYEREYAAKEDRRKALAALVNDPELEKQLSVELDKQYAEWARLVREFMDGSEEWDAYADFLSGKRKATIVRMLELDKLPSDLTCPIGFTLHISEKSPSAVNGNGISGKRASEMNEEFLLKVEDRLRTDGVPAVLLCRRFLGVGNTPPYLLLRSLVREYGKGCTAGGATFLFTHE